MYGKNKTKEEIDELRRKITERHADKFYRKHGKTYYQFKKENDVCGIYKIINKINGKYYVGSSCYIYDRWLNHKRKLNCCSHVNPHLQNAWNKYKSEAFDFVIEEITTNENRLMIEQKYLDKAKLDDNVYNTSFIASGGAIWKNGINPMLGKHHSEKTKKAWSEQRRGLGTKHSDKTIHKFVNLKTGEKFAGTRCDLHYQKNVPYHGISRIVSGKRKHYCQWSLE